MAATSRGGVIRVVLLDATDLPGSSDLSSLVTVAHGENVGSTHCITRGGTSPTFNSTFSFPYEVDSPIEFNVLDGGPDGKSIATAVCHTDKILAENRWSGCVQLRPKGNVNVIVDFSEKPKNNLTKATILIGSGTDFTDPSLTEARVALAMGTNNWTTFYATKRDLNYFDWNRSVELNYNCEQQLCVEIYDGDNQLKASARVDMWGLQSQGNCGSLGYLPVADENNNVIGRIGIRIELWDPQEPKNGKPAEGSQSSRSKVGRPASSNKTPRSARPEASLNMPKGSEALKPAPLPLPPRKANPFDMTMMNNKNGLNNATPQGKNANSKRSVSPVSPSNAKNSHADKALSDALQELATDAAAAREAAEAAAIAAGLHPSVSSKEAARKAADAAEASEAAEMELAALVRGSPGTTGNGKDAVAAAKAATMKAKTMKRNAVEAAQIALLGAADEALRSGRESNRRTNQSASTTSDLSRLFPDCKQMQEKADVAQHQDQLTASALAECEGRVAEAHGLAASDEGPKRLVIVVKEAVDLANRIATAERIAAAAAHECARLAKQRHKEARQRKRAEDSLGRRDGHGCTQTSAATARPRAEAYPAGSSTGGCAASGGRYRDFSNDYDYDNEDMAQGGDQREMWSYSPFAHSMVPLTSGFSRRSDGQTPVAATSRVARGNGSYAFYPATEAAVPNPSLELVVDPTSDGLISGVPDCCVCCTLRPGPSTSNKWFWSTATEAAATAKP